MANTCSHQRTLLPGSLRGQILQLLFPATSDSPDGAVHWPNPKKKPGGKQAVNVHPTDEPAGAWSGRKEMWSESGGGNGSRPASSSRMDVNRGRGRGVGDDGA